MKFVQTVPKLFAQIVLLFGWVVLFGVGLPFMNCFRTHVDKFWTPVPVGRGYWKTIIRTIFQLFSSMPSVK